MTIREPGADYAPSVRFAALVLAGFSGMTSDFQVSFERELASSQFAAGSDRSEDRSGIETRLGISTRRIFRCGDRLEGGRGLKRHDPEPYRQGGVVATGPCSNQAGS